MQAYLKGTFGKEYTETEYKYGSLKNTDDDDDSYYSYGAGIDFSLGENGNFIAGLEYRMHNDDDGKFAASTGVNIGWRFGKSSSTGSNSTDW